MHSGSEPSPHLPNWIFFVPGKKAHQSAEIPGRDKELFGLMVNELLSISMGYLSRKEGKEGREGELIFRE